MTESKNTERSNPVSLVLAIVLAVVAGVIRLVPHSVNATPLNALGLFGGSKLRVWLAAFLPMLVMFITDCILWIKLGWAPFNPYVYGSFLLSALLGRLFLSQQPSPWKIAGFGVLTAVQFFLITNLGVWVATNKPVEDMPPGLAYVEVANPDLPYADVFYARSIGGLTTCYVRALPFARNQFIGDLFFIAVIFAANSLLCRLPLRRPVPVEG